MKTWRSRLFDLIRFEPEKPPEQPAARSVAPAEIITAVYQSLLKREPDAIPAMHYEHALNHGKPVRELLTEVLQSEEFITRFADERRRLEASETVTKLFKLLLDRDPDKEGLRHHSELFAREPLDTILSELISSEEFKTRIIAQHVAATPGASPVYSDALKGLATVVALIEDVVGARLLAADYSLQCGGPAQTSNDTVALIEKARSLLMTIALCPTMH